ncbi:DUF898 family protein [Niveispirillum sp. SYP-B3756]|uniref:DUF898 family protein n=1 Tax=Niveispirillum sp. SYP-B3756 TaxID=2662178 RepID=UPI00156356D9|nr:DUF898 family protein [Niveispirillum sp. SYP-B3756]
MTISQENWGQGEPVHAAGDGGEPRSARLAVAVSRGALLALALKNLFFTILTIGFYRFWARTHVRRRLWGSVSIQGQPLAYTGRAKELFVGFLLALVILLPAFGLIGLVGALVPPTSVGAQMLFQGGVFLVLGVLGVMALYFARRYLLTRTVWRGIHAGQAGTLGRFMAIHIGYYLLLVPTLGLLNPWVQARLYNYRTGITFYGTQSFTAAASSRGLWLRWLICWALALLAYALFFYGYWPVMEWAKSLPEWQVAGLPPPQQPTPLFLPMGLGIALLPLAAIAYAFYNAARLARFTAATQLGDIRFSFPVSPWRLLLIPLVAGLIMVGIVIVAGLLGVLTGFGIAAAGGTPGLLSAIGPFIIILLAFAGISIVNLVWTTVAYMKLVARYLLIDNIQAAEDILNRGMPAPRRGEGLADALGDVGI